LTTASTRSPLPSAGIGATNGVAVLRIGDHLAVVEHLVTALERHLQRRHRIEAEELQGDLACLGTQVRQQPLARMGHGVHPDRGGIGFVDGEFVASGKSGTREEFFVTPAHSSM
jgi:hypothetical protein